ncbi:MAG: HAMP domain-containing protein [Deltaproteobacteria bacterium]|nr:HAMP domain-containing protein [Deltaproteobacteria bacterium]
MLYKLFLVNLLVIFALATLLLGVNYSMNRTIIGGITQKMESDIARGLSVDLASYYMDRGSWDELIATPENWRATFWNHVNGKHETAFSKNSRSIPHGAGQPRGRIQGRRHPHPPKKVLASLLLRLSLLSPGKEVLLGSSTHSETAQYYEISRANQLFGWLVVDEPPIQDSPMYQYYLRRLLFMAIVTGLVGVLVAAVISFLFSRQITRPITQLTLAAKQLASRNFSLVIPIQTSDELAVLARGFNNVARELALFENRQKQWLMDISHELRTPLTVYRSC